MNISLSTDQIQQLVWAIDLAENTLEDLTDEDLQRLQIDIDRTKLFALAITLENLIKEKAGA
jgi:hypothetical protein